MFALVEVMNGRLAEIISALEKPLIFASRNQFSNITNVKDLERYIIRISQEALGLPLDELQRRGFQELMATFDNFDSQDLSLKRGKIEEGLRIVTKLKKVIPGRFHPLPGEITPEEVKKLATPIQHIKGVGPKLADVLGKKGIYTVADALYFIPRKYEDRRKIKKIVELLPGTIETVKGTILDMGVSSYKGGRKRIFEIAVSDATGVLIAKWFQFNEKYMKKRFKRGQRLILSGEIKQFSSQKEVHHPEVEIIESGEEESRNFQQIVPIYSETEGLYQKTLRRIMRRIVEDYASAVRDGIPREVIERQQLIGLSEALKMAHFPAMEDNIGELNDGRSPAHRRLIFDEFFFLELGLALRKKGLAIRKGISFAISDNYINKIKSILPFTLTPAQEKAVEEIVDDLRKPYPMNRLLQGDVGSGKTVVALLASLAVVENGYQVAFMAPTEILAEQHFTTMAWIVEKLGIRVALLTSRVKRAIRNILYQEIEEGKIPIVVGTHALIQEAVTFHKLGLTVIDEQHRFGVMQRATLKRKGDNPDVLVMTATPIPRTLGLTVYGDLDISIIDQLPPGRLPVVTKVYHERDREKVYQKIRDEVRNKRQVFIVYPLIEESEKLELLNATRMAEYLQKEVFPDYSVGLLHGRMEGSEKDTIMKEFLTKKIHILVSTTVIEVGIDIPNASLMVVEHAERFGLSQLHQLRGRVGRGEYQSQCILLTQFSRSDDAWRRLKIMERTADGFRIAEEDFAIRGPGEFLGTRQSGFPDFRVANMVRDVKILQEARKEAFLLVERDPSLSLPEHALTREVVKERWKGRLELASVG